MAEVMFEPTLTMPPAAAARTLDLSILIVTWNSERWIDRCLRSIPAACEGLEYEVVVHDNASEDRTLSIVGETGATVLRSSSNTGFAAGTNRAVNAATGRYLFLLNPDCGSSRARGAALQIPRVASERCRGRAAAHRRERSLAAALPVAPFADPSQSGVRGSAAGQGFPEVRPPRITAIAISISPSRGSSSNPPPRRCCCAAK